MKKNSTVELAGCKITSGRQAGVETANLTSVMNHYKLTPTESYESAKLGIDAHAKWYYTISSN